MPTITATMLPCEADADLDLDLDGDACLDCEGDGEVVVEHTRHGARIVPCPSWCAAAHRLYDDRGDHDRRKD